MKIHIRDLITTPIENIRNFPMGWILVESDYDSRWVTPREIELSWLLWEPLRPISTIAAIKTDIIIDAEFLTARHILDVSSKVIMLYRDTHNLQPPYAEEEGAIIYKFSNDFYNYIVANLGRYVDSTSIFDFINVTRNPEIKAIRDQVQPNEASIDEGHDKVLHVLKNSPALSDNKLSLYAKKNIVPVKQIMQCVYMIGFRSDICGRIIKTPCLDGYVHGIRRLPDSMAESRTASTSLFLIEDPLRLTEYLNRRIDLHSMYQRQLVYNDCGNREVMEISEALVKRHFVSLLGARAKVDGQWINLRPEHKKLFEGKSAYIRSPLHCRNHDPSNVCIGCYGELGYNFPMYSNIGHIAETAMGSINADSLMSYKHFVGSAAISTIDLNGIYSRFMKASDDGMGISLLPSMKKTKFKIVVDSRVDAKNLGDINQVDVDNLDIFKVTTLNAITILTYDSKGEIVDSSKISMCFGSRQSSFSNAALKYLKNYSWQLTDKGDYLMDFTHWDYNEVIFSLPRKQDSPMEYVCALGKVLVGGKGKAESNEARVNKAVANTLRYKGSLLKPLNAHATKEEATVALFALTNTDKSLNIVHCAIIVKAYLNKGPDDYRLPRGDEPYVIGSFDNNMAYRSMGPAMAYQRQLWPILSICNYIAPAPDGNPLDQLLLG